MNLLAEITNWPDAAVHIVGLVTACVAACFFFRYVMGSGD